MLNGEEPQVLSAERRDSPGPFRVVQVFSFDHLWWGVRSLRGSCSQLACQHGAGQR